MKGETEMTCAQIVALQRAQRTVADVHALLELRGSAPPHILRGWCQDCEAVVELASDHRCYCGSRSVVPHGGRRVA